MKTINIGVDLGCSATTRQPSSAMAIIDANGVLQERPLHFRRACELAEVVSRFNPRRIVLAVDAPRSVPDHTAENYAYRSCERAIKAVDPYAGSFSGAAALYLRWYEIERRYFRSIKVIETYPRVVWKRLGLPGRPKEFRRNRQEVWRKLAEFVQAPCDGFSPHQVDAGLCAYTAWCYAHSEADGYGKPGEGLIIIPAPGKSNPLPPEAERIDPKFQHLPCMSS